MRIPVLIILLASFIFLSGLTVEQIKNDDRLIWGEGRAENTELADKIALDGLTSQISTNVESSFYQRLEETNAVVSDECALEVNTYSSVKLYHTERLIDEAIYAPEIYVLRYVSRSDIENVFREREARVNSLILAGETAESENRIAAAVRNYYWAYALLPTIPLYKNLTYCFDGENEKNCYTGLENKLNYLLNGIKFSVTDKKLSRESNYVDFRVKADYKGIPVEGILVYYNDGYGETNPANWNLGKGKVRLNGSIAETSSEIKIYIDYSYRGHAYDEDVIQAIDEMDYRRLPAAIKNLKIKDVKTIKPQELKIELIETANCRAEIATEINTAVKEISAHIQSENYGAARKYFTLTGYKDFNRLIDYGNAQLLENELPLTLKEVNGLYVLRSIPLTFTFSGNNESFNEKVNFLFNKKGKVEGITFSLSERAISDIRAHSNISEKDQDLIICFMEMYKTSYCLQEIEFLEKVFTEDALIIVGTVVEKDPEYDVEGQLKQLGDEKVKYIQMEKSQYIDRLQKQFAEKKLINLHFSNTGLKSFEKDEQKIYGIQIEQYYYSNNYADNGYLFLLFNLTDLQNPRITVRSWQPEKFKDGSIVGMQDFRF